jgi:hypothetical protein
MLPVVEVSSPSGLPTIGNTIGAIVVGWGTSSLYVLTSHDRAACSPSFHVPDSFFGMLCIQVWTYYQRYPNDNWSYKVLVRPVLFVFHQAADALCVVLCDALTCARGLERSPAPRFSRCGTPISARLHRHLAFIIDQGPGGPPPSFCWTHSLVLRCTVGLL